MTLYESLGVLLLSGSTILLLIVILVVNKLERIRMSKGQRVMWLARAYKDYNETQYLIRFSEWFESKEAAREALKDQCQDLQHIVPHIETSKNVFTAIEERDVDKYDLISKSDVKSMNDEYDDNGRRHSHRIKTFPKMFRGEQ